METAELRARRGNSWLEDAFSQTWEELGDSDNSLPA